MDYVIGCDIGSQAVKSILLSIEGKLIAEAGSSYGIQYPHPTWAEQPVEYWIEALVESITTLVRESGIKGDQVRAIGLDAQVDGVVPIDSQGKALRSAILWLDRRAVHQCEEVTQRCDPQRVFEISGLNLDPYHVAPKIRWMADNQPEIYEASAYFLLPGSFVAYYLSGEIGIDYSNASSTLLLDVRTRRWSSELCACFDIPANRLPQIMPANVEIGTLLPHVAERLGLSPRTSIILGCGDEHAASLGAGVISSGTVCDIAGTAEPVCAAAERPLFDETGLVETHCHAHPDLWLLENPGFVSGGNYRWFHEQFAPDIEQAAQKSGVKVYELLNEAAGQIPPGSDGLILLPCLMGAVTPTWNSYARGTFIGFTLTHRRAHFVRALLEASAYALRDITDRMQAIDLPLTEIRAVGGGARSPLWRQIKADVTGLPVVALQTVETTALGAGILALSGAGLVGSLDQAVDMAVEVVERRDPDPSVQAKYEEYYQIYREAYFALLPVFEKAARIR